MDRSTVSPSSALYRFDVVPDGGGGWMLEEGCRRLFFGGTASTPTVGQSGTRVYLGDAVGTLIAVEAEDCADAWEVPLNSQIFGSIAVSSDNREMYAASGQGIFQVFDDGAQGRRGWTAQLDLYEDAPLPPIFREQNLLLTAIGANGLLIQAGFGRGGLPAQTGIVHVDRETGAPRWFAPGLEESVGAMAVAPGGVLYMSHAPLRRAFAFVAGATSVPPIGGFSKWSATRHDLLIRDAVCAGEDRARNAFAWREVCPDSAEADATQIAELVSQARRAAPAATASGDLTAEEWADVEKELRKVDRKLATGKLDHLDPVTQALRRACDILND